MTPIERLQRLRDVFVDVPSNLIYMAAFKGHNDCGTTHCLAGWGAVDPVLIADGMPDVNDPNYWANRPRKDEHIDDWSELGEFFGLSEDDANKLFGAEMTGGTDISKDQVLQNLDLVLSGEKPFKYRDEYYYDNDD